MGKIIKIGFQNPVIKEIKDLRKTSNPKNLTIVEDLSILELRKKYPFRVKYFLFNDEITYREETQETITYLKKISENCYAISSKIYEQITDKDNRQGLLAVCYLNDYQINDFKDKPLVCITDNLENAGNLGTILRTCDSCKCDLLINVDSKVNLNNFKVTSSSRGMIFKVPVINMTYLEAQNFLLENKYDIYLGEPLLGSNYCELAYEKKMAIVVGSERYGINKEWYNHPHIKVFIPMYGEMGSLNVGVAASIMLYEARMKKEANAKKH